MVVCLYWWCSFFVVCGLWFVSVCCLVLVECCLLLVVCWLLSVCMCLVYALLFYVIVHCLLFFFVVCRLSHVACVLSLAS